jgi:poly(A) polymerase
VTVPAALLDALHHEDPYGALSDLDASGALTQIFPELEAGRGFKQPERHYFDVLGHNLATVEKIERAIGGPDSADLRGILSWLDIDEALQRRVGAYPIRVLLRLSALLHDVAKPASHTFKEGALKFPGHGPLGARLMAERLPQAGLGPEETAFVTTMIRYHLRPIELVKAWPAPDQAVRRFVTMLNGHVLPLMLVNLADGWATWGPNYQNDNFRRHSGFVNYVTARAWAVMQPGEPPLITGEELMATYDLQGSRLLGAVLKATRAAQEKGEVTSHATALAFAQELLAAMRRDEPPSA